MIRRYLLDTGIAQDYQAGRGAIRARAIMHRKDGHRIGICVPVLGELWSGVECSSSRERNLVLLRRALSTLVIWPFTAEAAEENGRIFAELRRTGRIIQQIDMQIGAIARTLPNCIVVSKDSDLSAISGVTVENWAVLTGSRDEP
jgi:tRNA(fMet)-specific endonuclease VapC